MKSKQEVIQEAWGEYWDELKQFICENGWISWGYRGSASNKNPASLADMYRYCGGQENHQSKYVTNPKRTTLFRPKSLEGIENNNGWINCEEKIPTETGKYWVIYKDDRYKMDEAVFYKDKGWDCFLTVYQWQPIIKPEPSLY